MPINTLSLQAIFLAWRGISASYANYYNLIYKSRKQEALEKLALLKQTYINHGAKALEDAIGNSIKYKADPIDHAKSPWVTIIDGFGDCEDMMLLVNECIPGCKLYDLVRMKNGKMVDYKTKWHFVLLDPDGVVWSNGKQVNIDVDGYAKRLKSTHIVQLDAKLYIKSVVNT